MRPGKLIFTVFVAISLAIALTFSPVAAQVKPIIWKVQGYVPAGMIYHDHLLHLAETVKEISGGRLVFDVHPVGAIVPTFEGLKATSDGAIDAHYGYSALWMGKIPAAALLCSLPCGFEAVDFLMWMEHGGGNELYQEMYDKYGYNVKVFTIGAMSMQIFQWSKKPLRTLKDMKGVKMRMMPLMGDILKAHGFSIAYLPAAEILPALERGVIDAAEYGTPAFDITAGYHKVCKFYHYPGIHQPASINELLVNKKKYDALPQELKVLLARACYHEVLWRFLNEEALSVKALEEFKKNGNVLVMIEEESVKTMTKWAKDYLDEQGKKDAFFSKVWESIKAWEKKWYPYVKMNRTPR